MPKLDLDLNDLANEAEEDSAQSIKDAVKQFLRAFKGFAENDAFDAEDRVALINALTEQAKTGRRQVRDHQPLQLDAGTSAPQNDVSATFAAMGATLGFDTPEAFLNHVGTTYGPVARIPAANTEARAHRLTSIQAAAHAQAGTAYELDADGNPVMPGKLRQAAEDLREEKEKVARLDWAEEHTAHLERRHATPAARQVDIDAMLKTAKGEPLPAATSENDAHIAKIKDKGKHKKTGSWNGGKEYIEIHKDDVTNDVWDAIKK